jgi:hypothetical protein
VAPYYVGSVELVGLPGSYLVDVAVVGEQALIGREVTNNFAVLLDRGRRVVVEL